MAQLSVFQSLFNEIELVPGRAFALIPNLKRQIEESKEAYITANYDRERQVWTACDGLRDDENGDNLSQCIETHQAHIRLLSFQIRWLEELLAAQPYNPLRASREEDKYLPLLSLRRWYLGLDLQTEGMHPIMRGDLMPLNGSHHSIGNWNCRGCLAGALPTEEGPVAEKIIEWCPKFIKPLRNLSYEEYMKAYPHGCYAGLLHSDMAIREEDGKTIITITKKCDMCNYQTVEEKIGKTDEVSA